MSRALARNVHWTEEEYLSIEEGSAIKHEYFDGEVYAMAGAKSRHNIIAANTTAALVKLVSGGSCHVFNSDQRIRVETPKKFYTYADGGLACGEWQISKKDEMSLENPVLLFEILSASTREYDRGKKLALYQQIPSLEDVLLIDQPQQVIEHHHRGSLGWKSTTRHRGAISLRGGAIRFEEIYNVPPGLPLDG